MTYTPPFTNNTPKPTQAQAQQHLEQFRLKVRAMCSAVDEMQIQLTIMERKWQTAAQELGVMHDIVIGMPDDPPPNEIVVTELAS